MSLPLYNLSGAKVSEVSEVKDCEYGSNVNGEYWKYANGLIVQFINKNLIIQCINQYGGVFISNNQQLPIPHNLKTCLYVNASTNSYGGAVFSNQVYINAMELNYRIANGTIFPDCSVAISAIIVGTWK